MNEATITYRQGAIVDGEVHEGPVIDPPVPLFRPTKAQPQPGPVDFVELMARKQRRQRAAARHRQVGRHRAAYVRREWAKEREANQLAQLFNLRDRLVPASPVMRERANRAIQSRIVYLRNKDQARYDREWKARQKNRNLPAPKPVISHDEVMSQLRMVAKTAPTVVPKAPRYDNGGWLPSGLTTVRNDTGRSELVGPLDSFTVGRTGRAG